MSKPIGRPPMPSAAPPARVSRDARPLVQRLVDLPHAEHLIPRLQPDVLHRIVLTNGLEDCGPLLALASPAQLQRVFDFDLWRRTRPGHDEELDADRFGTWLEVLMDAGPAVAAEKLLGMDPDFVAAALAQHIRVFDGGTVAAYTTLDGELVTPRPPAPGAHTADIGGFHVIARRTGAWDSVVPLLQYLDAEHRDGFAALMGRCRAQSNAGFEADASDELLIGGEQHLFDVTLDRTRRMEQQGYAAPAQARAFLQSARQLDLAGSAPPPRSRIADAYFHDVAEAAADAAGTNLHAEGADPQSSTGHASVDPAAVASGLADVASLLSDAGVMASPRALLGAAEPQPTSRLTQIQVFLRDVNARDPEAASMRLAELAFLTNIIAAGSSIQGRSLTVKEAGDAAVAACNLGLENWPHDWPIDGLLSVFQVGWAVLYRDVAMDTAQRLIEVLGQLRCRDREIELGLHSLRISLARHLRDGEPWGARNALEVIATLDLPAWAALMSLIDECPTMHAAVAASLDPRVRAIDPSAFEFISDNAQIAAVRRFMQKLPDTLTR